MSVYIGEDGNAHSRAEVPAMTDTEALIEELSQFEGSDALGNGDFSVCERAAQALSDLITENARLKADEDGLADVLKEIEDHSMDFWAASLAEAALAQWEKKA